MKESSRSGAPSIPATPATGVFFLSQSSFMILIIYFQTQSAKRVSRLLVIHPKHPEQIHRFAGHKQPIIIISSLPTAVITMHNVKRFLEDSAYVSHILFLLCSPKLNTQKMQLRTLPRSPRHRRGQPQTRRPHRHLSGMSRGSCFIMVCTFFFAIPWRVSFCRELWLI